ncbi:NAD(P)H-binding protein [Rhizobium laguerreae]|uniref:NAD(P)H-binding protein n=1 Tax=Rhizobium laguerreae TaxID=1076926 RepID=UPI0032B28C10
MLRKVYEDKDRQEDAIRVSTLDWTIVPPTVLNDNRRAVKAVTDLSGVHGGTIARPYVAEFVVHQLTADTWLRKAPVITSL